MTQPDAAKFNLNDLMAVIQDRKRNPKPESYTSRLFSLGEDEIVKKLGEEMVEVILAAKSQGQDRLREEVADWLYHLLVLLAYKELTLEDVIHELAVRHRQPG